MIIWTSYNQLQILLNTDQIPISVLNHIHKSKFCLLFDWQNTDESLVEHTSFRQLCYELCGLRAAWWWNVYLLGVFDITILKGKKGIVCSHSHLQVGMYDDNINIITLINMLDWASVTYMSSWVVSQQFLCCKDVPSMDKVTFNKLKERLGSHYEFSKNSRYDNSVFSD